MNTIWSDFVQNTGTLYASRMLRFSDAYMAAYRKIFNIDGRKRFLEIGCGPGALAQALARWYPGAEVIGIDRDAAFVQYAAQQAPHIQFLEADAAALPFEDGTFDVTISNTVQEHMEPSAFFGEQYRVLKEGGVCLVLSARRGISVETDCISARSRCEEAVWARVADRIEKFRQEHGVGQYAMRESELPSVMERYGFKQISTDYLAVNLTPDNPGNSRAQAYAMIDANRQTELDAVNALPRIAPDAVQSAEVEEMLRCVNSRYDRRIQLYDKGEKQWDTVVSMTMVLRGVK